MKILTIQNRLDNGYIIIVVYNNNLNIYNNNYIII